jgi:mannose-1-phosphate guanylyltransferase / mannose-6-phosphate isomerase
MNFEDYTIDSLSSLMQALVKIDNNNKRFLIVLDDEKVIGTLTDGDIRRQIIEGSKVSDIIKYKSEFKFINEGEDFDTVCDLFKSGIEFLPVINNDHKLSRIITKGQFEAFLLEGKVWTTNVEFFSIVENNFHIHNRPWGFYKSTLLSEFVQAKILTVFPGEQLSLQDHQKRDEHWIVLKGTSKVVLGESIFDVYPGKYIYIPRNCKHQIINNSSYNLILSEVQLGEYFGEDDIKRYSDKYGRFHMEDK